MKKTLLVILVIAAVAFSAVAGGLHYGIEGTVKYDFNLSEEHEGTNAAKFAFKPYVYNDNFTLRLLAEWRPQDDGAHGFDYLMDFDTTDFYTILASSLKYLDKLSIDTDYISLDVGKGTPREFDIDYVHEKKHQNRAQLYLNIGIVKVDVYATDFEWYDTVQDYTSLQYGDVKVNLGLVEVEAAITRQAYYFERNSLIFFSPGRNRYIPKVGAKLQFGLANVGFYFTTDMSYNVTDDDLKVKLFDRWVLEAVAEFKVGTFNLTGKFYLDNRLEGYSEFIFPHEALFGVRLDSKLDLNDFLTFEIYGDLPLKLNDGLRIVRNPFTNATMETVWAGIEVGTWWKIGGEIQVRGLISNIEAGKDFLTILKEATPTITAGIYTIPLDVTASAKLTFNEAHGDDIVPEITVGAVIRADNFLSNIK